MSAPPSIPPRPSRSSVTVPAVPPRPSSRTRSKSPLEQEEPALTTIPPSTELHAPVARLPTDSDSGVTTTSTATASTLKNESGIPQIGRRVPMYPNAGDVQAPSPAVTPGAGRKSHVYREEWEMDEGAYGQGTPRGVNLYSRSSVDLNQSVAQSPDLGDADAIPTPVPDEEIGYLASEQYARVISPQPTGGPAPGYSPTLRRGDPEEGGVSLYGIVANSSTSVDDKGDREISIHLDALPHHGGVYHHHHHHDSRAGTRPSTRPGSAMGMVSEDEEEEHEHPILASDEVQKRGGEFMLPAISPPLTARRTGSMPNTQPHSVAPTGPGSVAEEDEDGDVGSINLSSSGFELRESLLALQPGEKAEPLFPEDEDGNHEAVSKETGDVDKIQEKLKRPELPPSVSSGHRFPSKDIWEEAPDHSQLQATVSSPPIADPKAQDDDREEEKPAERSSSTPEYVQGQPHDHYEPGDEKEFEQRHKDAKKKDGDYRHEVQSEGRDEHLDRILRGGKNSEEAVCSGDRNGVQRFPSKDIWEDVPPSLQLSAIVTPSHEALEENPNEHDGRASTTGTTRLKGKAEEDDTGPTTGAPIEESSATKPGAPARPQVPPTRPTRKVPPQAGISTSTSGTVLENAQVSPDKKAPPGLPDRPKPKVPIRPNKPATTMARSPSTEAPVASSGSSGGVAPSNPPPVSSKPKPAIPPRAGGIGGKIATLKAGFMSDLDQRLKLGPQAPPPPKQEEKPFEEEDKPKEVLSDVRKSRAKGPRGRKLPTTKEAEAKREAKVDPAPFKMEMVGVWTVWSMDGEGVNVSDESATTSGCKSKPEPKPVPKAEEQEETAPTPSTTTLVGVTGTGQQTVSAVDKDFEISITSNISKAEEKEENGEIPTIIPTSQHPEDTTETGKTENERVDRVRQEDVRNIEGDQKVEV